MHGIPHLCGIIRDELQPACMWAGMTESAEHFFSVICQARAQLADDDNSSFFASFVNGKSLDPELESSFPSLKVIYCMRWKGPR